MDTPLPHPSPPRTADDLTPLDRLVRAKEARDVVRDQLVKACRRGDGSDVTGLLRADEIASEALEIAQEAYFRSARSDSRFSPQPEERAA